MFSNEDYLADLLVEAGAVDPSVLDQARRKGGSVIERLLSDTDLSENTVCAVLAQNAGIEANARQFVPAANAPWESRFPGLFTIRDGLMKTGQLTGPGLGAVPSKSSG